VTKTSESYKNLAWQNRLRVAIFLGILLVLFATIFLVKGLLLSVVIALIITYLLNPWVARLESAGLSRTASSAIVFLVFTGIVVGFGAALSPFVTQQIAALQSQLPKYVNGSVELIKKLQLQVALTTNNVAQFHIEERFTTWAEDQSRMLLLNLPQYLSSSASVLLLSPFIGFFLLKDGRMFARSLLQIVPNNLFEMILNLQYQINDQIAHYIRARIFEAIIVGLVVLVGLLLIQFPYASILAIFAGVTNLIPYVGPLVGAIPALVISLINQDPQFFLVAVLIVYALAQLIDMFLVIPLVVAKIVDLHPITVIVAVIIGAQLLGVLGMVISIPVFSALKVTFVSVYKHVTDFS